MPDQAHDQAGAHKHGATLTDRRANALAFALVANALFLVVELVGGLVFGSLALLADAAHMVSDVFALTLALIAQILSTRPPTERHTYGFVRAEVLAAQANGVLLFAGAIAVGVEAVRRLQHAHHLHAWPVLVVGVLGFAVNLVSGYVLGREARGSLNLRAAMWHLAFDALGSVAVVVAAVGVLVADATWLDPIASLVITVLVVGAAWHLLRGTTRVLLEGAPRGIDVAAVREALAVEPDVETVHHVHVWSLASEVPALSAHIVLAGEDWTLHDAQVRMDALKQMLADRFGIVHATLEVECHACEAEREHT
ncbi:MAG: cation diffusion facilitator family transporter [Actinomycetia bacterium]|nr:cation diffusion facilitator family transporter [Actinomycetes bacterium]